MLIQAYDPGELTGFCQFRIVDNTPVLVNSKEFRTWTELDQWIHPDVDYLIYESFTIRTMAVNPIPLEVIGVIKYLCKKSGINPIPQTPVQRTHADRVFKNQLADIKSLESRGIVYEHRGDAIRHALTYMNLKLYIRNLPNLQLLGS